MILHKNEELFKELILATAQELGLPSLYIEKDYWVTYILKSLSKSEYNNRVIFKGGTALSKADKIIERFSEDIDLAIITQGLGSNQIKKLIKKVESAILDDNFLEDKKHKLSSKGSEFRKTVHHYPKLEDGDFGHAIESIILEINSFAKPYPFGLREISCYIADFVLPRVPNMLKEYQLESFKINVLDIRRTFCEKLSAVARASYESDKDFLTLKEKIRHLYDIYFLMQKREIIEFLNSDEFIKLMKIVRSDDIAQFESKWASNPLYSTTLFLDTDMVLDRLQRYYKTVFASLVYGNNLPKIDDIKIEIIKIAKILRETQI
jgi:hypothetical protein